MNKFEIMKACAGLSQIETKRTGTLKAYQKRNRKNANASERKFGELLQSIIRTEQLFVIHQKLIDLHKFNKAYILDYYLPQIKLAFECDGAMHDEAGHKEYDRIRDARLKDVGIKVIRVKSQELNEPEQLATRLRIAIRNEPEQLAPG